MFRDELSVIDDHSFVVSNAAGDLLPGVSHGFFYEDTRFLSSMILELNGQTPMLLSAGNVGHNSATVYATNASRGDLSKGSVTLVRERSVCGGLHEDIVVVNHLNRAVSVELTIDFAADFADIFEVRVGDVVKAGEVSARALDEGALLFEYRRVDFVRQTLISFSRRPTIAGGRATFALRLEPKQQWHVCLGISPVVEGKAIEVCCPAGNSNRGDAVGVPAVLSDAGGRIGEPPWLGEPPRLRTEDTVLAEAYRRSLEDLQALGLRTESGHRVPAAGLPWYMAIFGRDSLITSLQSLVLGPEMALGVLRALAQYQGHRKDDFRDEQPGKIPHELRSGELACLDDVPHSRYYGTADATPLFIVLLSETVRWTGDLELARELLPAAEKAMGWIDQYGDADGDGFVEYRRRSPHGLLNQGWKDSEDSICFADATIASAPIALVEVQGYVYDAKRRLAELYRMLGNPEQAGQMDDQAERLRQRFEEAFWMPTEAYYALALDARKRQVNSITSNPGHCLWSGIIAPDRASCVVERLLAEDMFSGWGVRTMSVLMGAYNPISYHNGSVWPHDNSLIVAGMARYGFGREAVLAARAVLEASAFFADHRLPELFAGYTRRPGGFPVEYPGAGAPQAWAAGATPLFLATLLGIRPGQDQLESAPLPGVGGLVLEGVRYRGRSWDVRAAERAATA